MMSSQAFFVLPRPLLTGLDSTRRTVASIGLPRACPNNRKRFSSIFCSMDATPISEYISSQMDSLDTCLQAKSQKETDRNLGNFSPCIWGDYFASLSLDDSASEAYTNEIEGLKTHVRAMVMDIAMGFIEKVSLINTLYRLGVSYLFEKEIYGQLDIYFSNINLNNYEECDLHTISVHFQLFRIHGHKMSCDVFNRFTNEGGKFKENIANDVMGMLSLYESSQLKVQGEDVLEEAETFTKIHLEHIATNNKTHHLAKRITRALEQCCHKGIPRVEARKYISFYEEDKSHNELILRLAKLDFNLLQLLYQKELNILSRWSKENEFPSKSSYARDRVVEGHLFAIALCFEPRYTWARIIVSKIIVLGTRLDDIYDSFGKFQELVPFNDAINRWDISAIDQLPDYMKFVYNAVLNVYDEFYEQGDACGRSYTVDYSIEDMKSLSRAYLKVAEWFENKYIPSVDEYLKTAHHSTGFYLCIVSAFIGMFDCANRDTFEWLKRQPKILDATDSISRLQNDIVDRKFDQRGGRAASAIECYREEHGVSENEAIEAIEGMIVNSWKDLYGEYLKPSVVPLRILRMFVDFAASIDVVYKYEDGYNNPESVKDIVMLLLVDPVPI